MWSVSHVASLALGFPSSTCAIAFAVPPGMMQMGNDAERESCRFNKPVITLRTRRREERKRTPTRTKEPKIVNVTTV